MILSCNNISKSFDSKVILSSCSFHIEDHEKAAIVGMNGAGKSTFFKIITGEISADDGLVTISKDKTLAYLSQHPDVTLQNTIYEEMLTVKKELIAMENRIRELEMEIKELSGNELEERLETYSRLTHNFELNNGYAYKSEITGVLKGLGFREEDFDRKIETLSGGQKTRVFLSRILLSNPDIILLDEPTNHLDLNSIAWLETFLSNYKGAVIVISHDRYFLDKIVTKVIEIEDCKCTTYSGNYSDYAIKKEALRDSMLKQYYNQQREIKHQEQVIEKLKSFNREKSIRRAESREKQLEKIEVIEKPKFIDDKMHLKLTPRKVSGNDVLSVNELSKSFDSNTLFTDLHFEIRRGEKVGIIGNNGTGKTTILKIINGLVSPDTGELKLGSNVEIGYYDQEHHVLNMDKTLFEEISDTYPEMTNTEIRNVLAAFLFTGDDVFKYIRELSGGERGRVSLAKLMLSNANFLILDEPTNHLDITSKEILENAINNYDGTILYVSHDRYFINKTATRLLELVNQKMVNYLGNFDYYLEKRDELTTIFAAPVSQFASAEKKESESKLDWKSMKEEQAKVRKRENDLKKTEARITELEEKSSVLSEEMNKPEIASNVSELMKISKEIETINEELDALYAKWESLSE
ncbi:MAG: ABC-F family ATP-binding cassette domain-containing protein [Lachnospiraceae bacterium]|nr:ABC-F family ATP-binding cassette domain-containing protein [Lachnospiraceae bacterium]